MNTVEVASSWEHDKRATKNHRSDGWRPGSGWVRVGLVALLSVGLSACAWVDLAPEAEPVRVVASTADAAHCEKAGEIGTSTMARFLFVSRGKKKIATELDTLARNDAAKLGANVVAPLGPVSMEGGRRYAAFRCEQ